MVETVSHFCKSTYLSLSPLALIHWQRSLRSTIKLDNVLEHAKALESFAYKSPLRNRLLGTQGHNDTVTYLYNQLTAPALEGYYNVTLQPWLGTVQVSGTGSLTVNGGFRNVSVADFSPSGNASAPIAVVRNLGCSAVSYIPFSS